MSVEQIKEPLKVLVIDDEAGIRELCKMVATSRGADASGAGTIAQGRELALSLKPDYIILDIQLPDGNGLDLLRELRVALPATRVVMVTGMSTVEIAVEAMKLGAYDYLRKPHIVPQLQDILSRSVRTEPPTGERVFAGLVGISPSMRDVFGLIDKAARSDSTVLIQGESGTGKELVARAVHDRSRRAPEPFVPVDCGAIAPTLIESELFGHVSGAFTDAKSAAPGLLRAAGSGSVFLDEIGELPVAVQVKLLRALQELEVRPVGGTKAEPLAARIIAATNRDLAAEVAVGHFRRDLFYRLHVIPIFLPPLRERREDIPLLVEYFVRACADPAHPEEMAVTPEVMKQLMLRDWLGNVRELENFIRRAYALLDNRVLDERGLAILSNGSPKPATVQSVPDPSQASAAAALATGSIQPSALSPSLAAHGLLAERAAETIRQAIAQAGGNKRKAARILGIGIATLYRKIHKFGIQL